jgi:hypothetical protein
MELDEDRLWKDINESVVAAEVASGRLPLEPKPTLVDQDAIVIPLYRDGKLWGFDLKVTAVFTGRYEIKEKS